MKRIPNPNAKAALEKMKLEIANELDARLANEEKSDGTMTRDLVMRAEKKINDIDTVNPS